MGELMRRGGVWKGKRLLSKTYMRDSITPTKTNGCYGYLIWLNRDAPCVGPTITERPVDDQREFPDLPEDMYRFSGLFGQLVTVFPSQGIVVARNGQDKGLLPTGGSSWEHTLYRKVLAAVTDQKIPPPPRRPTAARRRSRTPTTASRRRWPTRTSTPRAWPRTRCRPPACPGRAPCGWAR